jgi:hypothetical protein
MIIFTWFLRSEVEQLSIGTGCFMINWPKNHPLTVLHHLDFFPKSLKYDGYLLSKTGVCGVIRFRASETVFVGQFSTITYSLTLIGLKRNGYHSIFFQDLKWYVYLLQARATTPWFWELVPYGFGPQTKPPPFYKFDFNWSALERLSCRSSFWFWTPNKTSSVLQNLTLIGLR